MMHIRDLRERVQFQTLSKKQDEGGGYSEVWTNAIECAANVNSSSGGEIFRAAQIQADVKFIVTIRFQTGLYVTMRILWRGKILDIISINDPDGHKRWLQIWANERADSTGSDIFNN